MIVKAFVPQETITDFQGRWIFQIQPITEKEARQLLAAVHQQPIHTITKADMLILKQRGWHVGHIVGVNDVHLYWGVIGNAPALTRVICVADMNVRLAA